MEKESTSITFKIVLNEEDIKINKVILGERLKKFEELNKNFLKKEFKTKDRDVIFITEKNHMSCGGVMFKDDINKKLNYKNKIINNKEYSNYKSSAMLYQIKELKTDEQNKNYQFQISNSSYNMLILNTKTMELTVEVFDEGLKYDLEERNAIEYKKKKVLELLRNTLDGLEQRVKILIEKKDEIDSHLKNLNLKLQKENSKLKELNERYNSISLN